MSTFCQETKKHLNRKVGSEGTLRLDPHWKLQFVALQRKHGVWIRIMAINKKFSLVGQNFTWLEKVGHKLEQQWARRRRAVNLRNAVRKLCVKILNANNFACRSKAKAKPQRRDFYKNYLLARELVPMLNQENIQSPIIQCHGNWFIFFLEVYLEILMERLNSGEWKTIFRKNYCTVIIGLTKSGRKAWQEEEKETRKDTSIAQIHQEQSCTSELFKAIQDWVS